MDWDDWLALTDDVQHAVGQLDDESTAKLTLKLIDYDIDDEAYSTDESDL